MSSPLLLNGVVDDRDPIISNLEDENARLNQEVLELRAEISRVRTESGRSVANLRRQLTPLYQALRSVFGEMDAIGDAPGAEAPAVNNRVKQVWDAWKQKLPGYPARFIDALLLHGEMSAQQLRVAMQCATDTVYQTATRLNKLGLISKNGSRYKLKEL